MVAAGFIVIEVWRAGRLELVSAGRTRELGRVSGKGAYSKSSGRDIAMTVEPQKVREVD